MVSRGKARRRKRGNLPSEIAFYLVCYLKLPPSQGGPSYTSKAHLDTSSGKASYSSNSTLWQIDIQNNHQEPSRQPMCSSAWAAIPWAKITNVLTVWETQKSQTQCQLACPEESSGKIYSRLHLLVCKGRLPFVPLPASYVDLCVQNSPSEKHTS